MHNKDFRRNNIIIGVLLCIVAIMAVGFAAFNSKLDIKGTANSATNWCVGFDSSKTSDYTTVTGKTGGTAPTGTMAYDGTACGGSYKPTANLSANLKQPGDKVVYTLTIKNASTLAAAIESIEVDNSTVTSDTTITKGNVKFKIEMPESTSIASNAATTMKVTVEFQNDTNVNSLTSAENQSINVKVNAVQDNGNGGFEKTFTGTIYRWNANNLAISGSIVAGTAKIYNITSDGVYGHGPTGEYETLEACEDARTNNYGSYGECKEFLKEPGAGEYKTVASELNKSYYLKHDVVDNIVTASYACFVTDTEHCMKGADNGASYSANKQILKDYQTFYNLSDVVNPSPSNPGCDYGSSRSICYGGGFYEVYADSDGRVNVNGSSSEDCSVYNDGGSRCDQY